MRAHFETQEAQVNQCLKRSCCIHLWRCETVECLRGKAVVSYKLRCPPNCQGWRWQVAAMILRTNLGIPELADDKHPWLVISLDIARVSRLSSVCNQALLGMDPFGMFANWRMHTFSSLCLLLSMLPLRSQAQRTYRLNHVSRVEGSKERFDASIWKDAFGFTRLVNSYN